MHPFIQKLREEQAEKNTLLCFGMDPVIERMRIDPSNNLADEIVLYFSKILDVISGKIAAVKPNIGFYLQYGHDGLRALSELVNYSKSLHLPVIMDAKMGDIGRTSRAYAVFIFEIIGGDAVTLNPYMGYDSMEPFFSHSDKGFYVLALTSNPGAADFQWEELKSPSLLYEYVIQTICSWNKSCASIGAVIGATQDALQGCVVKLRETGCIIPLLIPGVGAQGGSYTRICKVLDKVGYERGVVRINASSSISYAHERYSSMSFEEASFLAVEEIIAT